eukprot:5684066-Pyramimonas_sp.AAC.1
MVVVRSPARARKIGNEQGWWGGVRFYHVYTHLLSCTHAKVGRFCWGGSVGAPVLHGGLVVHPGGLLLAVEVEGAPVLHGGLV